MPGSYYLLGKKIVDKLSGIQMTIPITDENSHHANNRPFNYWTTYDHSNTRLVRFLDPHSTAKINNFGLVKQVYAQSQKH